MKKLHFYWENNVSDEEWDSLLIKMRGHPLQSSLWGNGRQIVEGIMQQRWVAHKDNQPIAMFRFEDKNVFKFTKVAWIPKGPVYQSITYKESLHHDIKLILGSQNYFYYITNDKQKNAADEEETFSEKPSIINLSPGREQVWEHLEPRLKSGIRNAFKNGITVHQRKDAHIIQLFAKFHKEQAEKRQFTLKISSDIISYLILHSNSRISAHLFIAEFKNVFCGGALVIRCGSSIHAMISAVDKKYQALKPYDALTWSVMEWAINNKCDLYNLEEIDTHNNYGTYRLKNKAPRQPSPD